MVPTDVRVPLELHLGPLLPEHLSEIVVGIVLMLIVWIVMVKKVVPAFETMYEERAAAIQGGLERAERAQREADAALAEYRAQLAGAREEAAKIREDAKAQGAQVLAESREKAGLEANRLVAQAHLQIEAEKQQAMTQLRGEVGGLATTLAGKIVGDNLTDDQRVRATVDRFIADLEQGSTTTVGQPA